MDFFAQTVRFMPSSVNLRPVSRPRLFGLNTAVFVLAPAMTMACSLPKPAQGTRIRSIDGKRVAHAQLETHVNHTDLMTVDVVFPTSSDNGTPAMRGPAVVFLQDEDVAPADYEWLTDTIASWGYFVATPHHVGDRPRYNPGAASFTFDLLVSPPNGILQSNIDTSRISLIGHGEGGRIGAKVLKDRAYAGFTLLAGLPDEGDRGRLQAYAKPWRAFVGTADCEVSVGAVETALGAAHVTPLEGVGHEQFFEGGKAANGCPATIADEEARALITNALKPHVTGKPLDTGEGQDGGPDAQGADGGAS